MELHPGFARSFLIEILTAGPRALELRGVRALRVADEGLVSAAAPAELQLEALPDEVFRAAVGASNELVVTRLERRGEPGQRPLEELVLYSLLSRRGALR
ncbi:MAG TPA: hypothetical protein VGY32_07480 [Solirubrobacteraceae bacterium]|jgi:hypothetical protein|nr:hypothetical protein [Solirubrobacteraceae bacterium]